MSDWRKMAKRKWKLKGGDDLYLVVINNRYYVHGTLDGKRIRKTCRTNRQDRAERFLEIFKREYISGFQTDYDDPDRDWQEVAALACQRQEANANKRGIPFKLKPNDVYLSMRSTRFRCAVSGIPLAKRLVLGGERDPWAPSIDRIESRHGYTDDNIRVVCLAANYAMNAWGLDVLLRLARGVLRSSTLVAEDEILEKSGLQADKVTENTAQVIDFATKLEKP